MMVTPVDANALLNWWDGLFSAAWLGALWRASWQGGLALLMVWLVTRRWSRLPLWVREWLWRLAYLKLLLAWIWAGSLTLGMLPPAPARLTSAVSPPSAAITTGVSVDEPHALSSNSSPAQTPATPPDVIAATPSHACTCTASATPAPGFVPAHRWQWSNLIPLAGTLWLLGMAWGILRLLLAVRHVRRLRAECRPVDDPKVLKLRVEMVKQLGLRKAPMLLSHPTQGPLLVGTFHPVILVPAVLLDGDPAALRLVLAHELAHVRRHDILWGWLPALVELCFFFHPLVHLARREARLVQEIATDAQAITRTGTAPQTYGAMLVENAVRQAGYHPMPIAIGILESFQTLQRRLTAMNEMRMVGSRKRCTLSLALVGILAPLILLPWRLSSAQEPVVLAGQQPTSPLRIMPQLGMGYVNKVALSPDGRQALTGTDNTMAYLWDTATGLLLHTFAHRYHIDNVAFSPDGRQVLTEGVSGEVFIWDALTGRLLKTDEKYPEEVKGLTSLPDGRQLDSGGRENLAYLKDAGTEKRLQTFTGKSSRVYSVAFSPDNRRILTGHGDKTVRLWDVASGKMQRTLRAHTGEVNSVAFSPDGRQIVTASSDSKVCLWDAETGQLLRTLQHPSGVKSVAFSHDGRQVLTGEIKRTARLWNAETGAQLQIFKGGHTSWVYGVAFSPDDRQVLTGGDTSVCLWDAATGKLLRTFTGEDGSVQCTAFSPDGRYVLAGGTSYTAHLWDAATGKVLRTFQCHGWVDSVSFSADGKKVLTGCWDHTACLWDTETGELLQTFKGHDSWVQSAALSQNGQFVVTGSIDSTTKLWDAGSGRVLCTLLAFDNEKWAVFDPAGRYDTPDGNDAGGLHWVVGDKPLVLSKLKDPFYNPGLLAKVMGVNKEPLRELPSPADLQQLLTRIN